MHERFTLSREELEKLTQKKPASAQVDFPHLSSGEVLDSSDFECFAELKEVLKKHGKIDKFGVTLLHKHFDLNEGETLVESTDASSRTMTIQPEVIDTSDISAIDTQWYLGTSMPLSLVKCRTSLHQ